MELSSREVRTFDTGNALLSDCTEIPEGVRYMHCLGYIAAAYDTHESWVNWGHVTSAIL